MEELRRTIGELEAGQCEGGQEGEEGGRGQGHTSGVWVWIRGISLMWMDSFWQACTMCLKRR